MAASAATVLLSGLMFVAAYALVYYIPVSAASESVVLTPSNRTSILDPNGSDVQFVLFTRNSQNNSPQYLIPKDEELFELSDFNNERPTKLIIHGFLSSINEDVFYIIRDAYMREGDYNIIGVDWSKLCANDYLNAMRGAYETAEHLGSLLNWMARRCGVRLQDIHIIGHSLGAHVAGLTADRISGNGKISRITGLDPAGPGFNEAPEWSRLDPGDASVVDIIHTSMQVLSLSHPVGHVDFYPNGGRAQPGCPDVFSYLKENMLCNHGRAYYLFAESILNKNAFKSQKCNTLDDAILSRCFEETDVYMGQADTYQYGLYYMKTRGSPPFSRS